MANASRARYLHFRVTLGVKGAQEAIVQAHHTWRDENHASMLFVDDVQCFNKS
jgi:hypothetical protein